MYDVSQDYLAAMRKKTRDDHISGSITFPDGSVITIDDENLVSGSLKLTEELCGGKYRIGTFDLSCLRFSFFIDNALGLDLTDAYTELSYSVRLGDGSFETVPLGIFLIDPVLSVRRKDILSIVAFDRGVKADTAIPDSLRQISVTPAELIAAACAECGLQTDITAGSLSAFPNSGVAVNAGENQIQSCRDLIMWCAALLCGYAHVGRDGKLVILPAKYAVSPEDSSVIITDRSIDEQERRCIRVTDTRAYIKYLTAYKGSNVTNYVSAYVSPDEQASPAVYVLEKNPLLAAADEAVQDSANRAWLAFIDSFKQRGVEAEIFGDPALDPGDTVVFRGGDVDQRGGIIGIVTYFEWNYRGIQKIVCSAAECAGSLLSGSTAASVSVRSQSDKCIDGLRKSGTVGENVGAHNERFNAYSNSGINANTITGGDYNHSEGARNTLVGCTYTHADGYNHSVTGGYSVNVSGNSNELLQGCNCTICSGLGNHLESANVSAVFGDGNRFVSGGLGQSLVCGGSNTNTDPDVSADTGTARYSVITGSGNVMTGDVMRSVITGLYQNITGPVRECVVTGSCNSLDNVREAFVGGEFADASGSDLRIVIGNGSSSALQNCFTVDENGDVSAHTYGSPGADYAEYFEWSDGNPENEDRTGMLVALDKDKIVPATGNGFVGAVSASPSVAGNSASLHWKGKYRTDIFGRIIAGNDGKPVISGDFDSEAVYIPRQERAEWAAVGLVGRLIVTDDGSCRPGGYASARDGVACGTTARTRARVLKRTDDTHVEVLIK